MVVSMVVKRKVLGWVLEVRLEQRRWPYCC